MTEPADPSSSRRVPAPWVQPAVLIALIVLALLGWQWFETRSRLLGLEQTLATRLAAADTVSAEARTLAKDTREAQRLIEERIGALDARLAQMQGQQGALDQLYQELARTRDDRLLAEAEQAINIANQQLQLAGNVGAALLALQGADAQLARSDRAHFLPLRKALHRDIDRLKALPAVDVPGMTLKIESLLAGVDALPLAFERKPGPAPREEAPPAGAVRALVADIWREIRALVRVERMDRPDPGLISPSQSVFLRENLKLRLLDARLALLARDDRVFKEDIKQARVWVERYFDNTASVTQATLEALSQLGQTRLSIELPVLTESLAAVKAVQGLPERAPVSRGGR